MDDDKKFVVIETHPDGQNNFSIELEKGTDLEAVGESVLNGNWRDDITGYSIRDKSEGAIVKDPFTRNR